MDQAPLTLIRAPAGTGKTVLAAEWVRLRSSVGLPAAWLSMTERDNQPAVFWAHLREALVLAGVLPAETDVRETAMDVADLDALAARLLERGSRVTIVVDAADRLHNRTVYDQVGWLVDAAGERVRMVMTSRVQPPLPIHRYRVEDKVAEIRADELALGPDEIDEVLLRHRLQPPKDASDMVIERTEGWAAGVRLAALQMATEGAEAELDGFAAPYVRAEILAGLTPLEREVLTATSVVDELPPGLAPALTGRVDADAVVRLLAEGNAFVLPVRGRPGVFRVHPLVRELLRADLDLHAADRSTTLHREAAEWFDAHGELESAVRQLATAGDWRTAAALVVEGRGLAEVVAGTTTGVALADELAPIPEIDSPAVTVLRVAIALRQGDLDQARGALDRAGTVAGIAVPFVRTAWCDAAGHPAETLAAAREARARLADVAAPDPLATAVVATAEGTAHLRVGHLDAASAALGEALAATAATDGPLRLRCLAELALAEACAGRLNQALEWADAAEEAAVEQGVAVTARPAALELARAWVAVERQELPQAQRSLNRLNRGRSGQDDEPWRTAAVLLQARYLRDRGDLRGARRQLGHADPDAAWLRAHLDAEVRCLEDDEHRLSPEQAGGSVGGVTGGSTGGSTGGVTGGVTDRVRELIASADRRCRAGDLAVARLEIGRALQLARVERLRRPFVHASPRVLALIRNDASMHALAGWLGAARPGTARPGGGAKEAARPAPPVLESLSERELQVLRHLAAFKTTEEIAAEMFISVNTVRSHVRRVLEKLAVSRRHEAVRRGQELGLV